MCDVLPPSRQGFFNQKTKLKTKLKQQHPKAPFSLVGMGGD
jgi:hypothetical protein